MDETAYESGDVQTSNQVIETFGVWNFHVNRWMHQGFHTEREGGGGEVCMGGWVCLQNRRALTVSGQKVCNTGGVTLAFIGFALACYKTPFSGGLAA